MGGKDNYQIGIHSNNELIENSGYTGDDSPPKALLTSLKEIGDQTRDCDLRDVPRNRWDPF